MRIDRVLNFEFMSGDRIFKNQSNRTMTGIALLNAKVIALSTAKTIALQSSINRITLIALSKAKVIAILKLNQQDDGDRTFTSWHYQPFYHFSIIGCIQFHSPYNNHT
jgi:hypothetical protein